MKGTFGRMNIFSHSDKEAEDDDGNNGDVNDGEVNDGEGSDDLVNNGDE